MPSPRTIHGKCHCGNIAFALDWPGDSTEIPARACGCTFCVKHGGVWTSNPNARLAVTIRDPALVSPYAFGTRTATFHVCSQCGAVPVVTSEIDGHTYAVVNVNVLEGVEPSALRRASSNFDGEDVNSRLGRRKRNWIADVRIWT
ncbi:MAG TPA: hypothetical protein VFJ68_09900 [Casimicrobiaceae bacterium]|nr:hypothetical protein [Casimicrobiaceae bacterium]